MEHPDFSIIAAHLAGELEEAETGAVERHLQECRACQGAAARWRELKEEGRRLAQLEPSPQFVAQVMGRLQCQPQSEKGAELWLQPLREWLWQIAACAASIVLLALYVQGRPAVTSDMLLLSGMDGVEDVAGADLSQGVSALLGETTRDLQ